MNMVLRAAAVLPVALLVAACAGAPTPTPVPTAPPVTPVPSPSSYTSAVYGYTLTLPGGWRAIQATAAWDGDSSSSHDSPAADQFIGPPPISSGWLMGTPTKRDLAAWVDATIAANAAGHSDTCPPVPDAKETVDFGGESGVVLSYNCGILINLALTVHQGKGYLFGFRDFYVHAATDPKDHATLVGLLKSVHFP